MKVNLEKIKALKPCQSRLDHYVALHADFSGTLTRFLNLDGIPNGDKCWVYFRMIPKEKLRYVVADIAESVLHIFEARYPNDKRPRLAIEAARGGKADAAYDAAYAAYDAAYAAAYDAAYDAAYAAHAAAHAAARAAPNQEAVQISIMKRHLKGL